MLERRRNRRARQSISARAEAARPADAVAHLMVRRRKRRLAPATALGRSVATRDGSQRLRAVAASRRAQSRISAACFRTLSITAQLSFFEASPDSIISAPEFSRDPATRRSRQAGQCSIAICPRRSPPHAAAPARADRPFRGIALILASTVFLGASDVTAKYLSATLPSIEIAWIRFLVFALIMSPAMLPGSPLYALHTQRPGLQLMRGVGAAGVFAVLHFRACGFFRSPRPPRPASSRRCSSPRCRSFFSARASACAAGWRPRWD